MNYELREFNNFDTMTTHDLEFENIVDIQCCLETVQKLKEAFKKPNAKEEIYNIVRWLPNLECLDDTIERMSAVTVPVTDY